MPNWAYAIISVGLVSAISLVGVLTLALQREQLKRMVLFLVSFAVGALFGDALIHLIPASFETIGFNLKTSLLIILGIMLFFGLEKFLRWQHCHITDDSH